MHFSIPSEFLKQPVYSPYPKLLKEIEGVTLLTTFVLPNQINLNIDFLLVDDY